MAVDVDGTALMFEVYQTWDSCHDVATSFLVRWFYLPARCVLEAVLCVESEVVIASNDNLCLEVSFPQPFGSSLKLVYVCCSLALLASGGRDQSYHLDLLYRQRVSAHHRVEA